MSKNDSDIVRLARKHVLDLFSSAPAEVPLIFHGYQRTRGLVEDSREIAKGNKLNGHEGEVLLLAAWFHGVGYGVSKEGGPEQSIAIARAFLEDHGKPKELTDAVVRCLSASDREDVRDGVAADVLHAALLAPLASKSYVEQVELLRLEEQQRTGTACSNAEWMRRLIDRLQQHTYRTRWAQLQYEGGRAKNLARLHRLLRREEERENEDKAEEVKLTRNGGRTASDLFAVLTRNQLKLLSVADRRTSTMIHVNAIMISLMVDLVLRKVEEHRNLIVPTIALLTVNLVVVFVSILSMRAGRELRGLDASTRPE